MILVRDISITLGYYDWWNEHTELFWPFFAISVAIAWVSHAVFKVI
jgi:hypothetical protein